MAKVGCDVICKSHSARSDRDPYRICPTKLSKQELENLYFVLLENNLELKKTINGQQDRIKILSTKVQRFTSAQNILRGEEKKDCCFATKAIVNQQKDLIIDLKRANERMAERIRKLNMRLCSAKQFCKSATPRCLRCSTATSPYLIKNSSHSLKQHSQSTLKLAVSCQNLSRESMITKCVQTDPFENIKAKEDKEICEDNKCKTLLDEAKQKVDNLNEELSRLQESQSSRLTTLEQELQQARGQRVAAEHELQRREKRNTQLVAALRTAEGLTAELKTQLSIEKRKVAELETRLKAATISNNVTKCIEDTLTSIQELNKSTIKDITFNCPCSPRHNSELNVQQSNRGFLSPKYDGDTSKLSKSTDDSGFIDVNKSPTFIDDQSFNKIIEDLSQRIVVLQAQVDYLTISPPEDESEKPNTIADITENIKNIATEIKPLPNPQINIQPPSKIPIKTKETVNHTKKDVIKNATKDTRSDEIAELPISESTPNWKTGAAKVNLVTKITKAVDKTTEGAALSKTTVDVPITMKTDLKPDSSNSEEKTYVCDKDKNAENDINNVNTDTSVCKKSVNNDNNGAAKDQKDKSGDKNNNNALEKDKSGVKTEVNCAQASINRSQKDNNVEEKVNGHKKDISGNEKETIHKVASQKNVVEKFIGQKHKEKSCFGVKMTDVIKNVEQKTQGARPKMLARSKTEYQDTSTCEEATYTVDYDNSTRPNSPDNTDFEISSMTDVSEDREPKSPFLNCLSPGEQKISSTLSDSRTSPTTNYSLSEGEIPVTTPGRSKSNGDKANHGPKVVPKMDETLQAISDELARCKRLLFSSRSQDNTMAP